MWKKEKENWKNLKETCKHAGNKPLCLFLLPDNHFTQRSQDFLFFTGLLEYKLLEQGGCFVACLLSHFGCQGEMKGDANLVKDAHSIIVKSDEVWKKIMYLWKAVFTKKG